MLLSQNFGSFKLIPTLLTSFSGDSVEPEERRLIYFLTKLFPSSLYFAKVHELIVLQRSKNNNRKEMNKMRYIHPPVFIIFRNIN